MRTEEGDLGRLAGAPLRIEPRLHLRGRSVGQGRGQRHRSHRVLTHAQVERRARQPEGVVQSLLHFHLEPAVDAAIDELERRQIHDQQRRNDQRPEDAHGARRETRAGHVRAIVAHQPPELARQQHAEGDHAAEVHQQNPRPQAVECGRVLHALGEQQERSQPDGAPQQRLRDRHPAQAPRALVHTGSNHEYHSLTRAQSLVQKRITRSDAGRCPRRTPARTLIV